MTEAKGQTRGDATFACCLLVVVGGLVLGGGARNGLIGDTFIQLAAVPLVVIGVGRLAKRGFDRFSTSEIVVLAGLLLLPLLQLLPLPPALWTRLPHADLRLIAFDLLGQKLDARPISLTPEATALGVLSLLPPLAVFVGARLLNTSQRRGLVLAVLVVGLASVFLGMLQLAGGEHSPLRFYSITNTDDAVGFFANRNHFAAFLYTSLLLATPWALESVLGMVRAPHDRGLQSARLIVAFASGTLMFLFGVCEIITRSRAGVALTLLAVLGIVVLVVVDRRNRWRKASLMLVGVAVIAVVLFAGQFGIDRFIDRLSANPGGDSRFVIAQHTLSAVISFLPFGSGIGSFQSLYGLLETKSDLIADTYINQAHDDLLQIALEAGAPGLLLLLVFIVTILTKAVGLFAAPDSRLAPLDIALARASLFAVLLLALHSLVDYPLRCSAGMIVFALCCANTGKPASARVTRPGTRHLERAVAQRN